MKTLLVPSREKSGNCHRMAPLRMLYSMILTYTFKVKHFLDVNIWKTVRAGKNAQEQLLYKLIFSIEWDHCECCTPWARPTFLRSNFSSDYFDTAEKMHALQLPSDRESGIMAFTYIFKFSIFQMWISRKQWTVSQKRVMTFTEVDNCHRNVPLWMLYSDLDI